MQKWEYCEWDKFIVADWGGLLYPRHLSHKFIKQEEYETNYLAVAH